LLQDGRLRSLWSGRRGFHLGEAPQARSAQSRAVEACSTEIRSPHGKIRAGFFIPNQGGLGDADFDLPRAALRRLGQAKLQHAIGQLCMNVLAVDGFGELERATEENTPKLALGADGCIPLTPGVDAKLAPLVLKIHLFTLDSWKVRTQEITFCVLEDVHRRCRHRKLMELLGGFVRVDRRQLFGFAHRVLLSQAWIAIWRGWASGCLCSS